MSCSTFAATSSMPSASSSTCALTASPVRRRRKPSMGLSSSPSGLRRARCLACDNDVRRSSIWTSIVAMRGQFCDRAFFVEIERDPHRAAAHLAVLDPRPITRRQVDSSAEGLSAPGTRKLDEFAERAARLRARLEDRLEAVELIHFRADQGAPGAAPASGTVRKISFSWRLE